MKVSPLKTGIGYHRLMDPMFDRERTSYSFQVVDSHLSKYSNILKAILTSRLQRPKMARFESQLVMPFS
jgi:hypothetical protein